MNTNRKRQVGLLLIVVLVSLLLVMATGGASAKSDPGVITPRSHAFGQNYGEWAVSWWQWAFSLPAYGNHPLLAEGDVDCNYGQGGKVWFLGGAPGEWAIGVNEVERTCTAPIPPGKALYLPVVNVICTTVDDDQITFGSLTNCANFVTDNFLIPKSAQIDDRVIEDFEAYRTVSPEFSYMTVEPPLYGHPSGVEHQGATGGYYLLLPPLSAGEHDIWFEGAIVVPPDTDWTTKVHYHFTVGK